MKPKRILIFSLAYFPRLVAGAEVAVKEITDRIDPKEIEFDLITLRLDRNSPRFEKIGNVNIYRVGDSSALSKLLIPITGTWETLKLLKKNHYYCFWPMMVTYSSGVPYIVNILRSLVGRSRIPVVLTLQEGDSKEYIRSKKFGLGGLIWHVLLFPFIVFLPKNLRPLGLIGISWALALRRSDRVTVISRYLKDQAVGYGCQCPIFVIPNGVDYDLFSKPIESKTRQSLRNQKGYKDSDTVLVTTSRLTAKNAVEDIIEALNYLPDNIKLLIVGQGEEEANLKSQISNLKLEDRVYFIGYLPHKEMVKYLQISDIFIRPSLSEGLGNSFLEAMAAGLPIIATPVGGIPDFLKDGETGLFCEVKNPRSIAQKVEKLIKDRESKEHIVRQARELVRNNYEWRAIAGKMKDILVADRL